jgi:hypothetical protein
VKVYRVQAVDGLARVLVVLLGIAGVANLLNSIVNFAFWQDATLILPLDERGGPFTTFPSPQGPVPGLIGAASSLAGLGAGITWLIWQHHATANLWARGFPGLKITPGWAVGWWFIPFANFVMPYLAVRELDRRSSADGAERRDHGVVGWWWAAYLLATVGLAVAYIAVFVSQGQRFIDALEAERPTIDLTLAMRQVTAWGIVGGVCTAVAAALAILVVRRITRHQADVMLGPLPPRPDVDIS